MTPPLRYEGPSEGVGIPLRAASLVAIALLLSGTAPVIGQDPAAPAVRTLIAAGHHPWAARPDFRLLREPIARLYGPEAAVPLWVRAGRASAAASAAIDQLVRAGEHGLDPGDYDAELLDSVARQLPELLSEARARFDVLLTVNLLRFLGDVRYGRRPGRPFSAGREPGAPDAVGLVSSVLGGASLPDLVGATEPQLAQYRSLRAALVRYRALAADTSQGRLPLDRFLWPGSSYDSLARLSRMLVATGDLPPDSVPSGDRYEGPIAAAVRRFQRRHALAPDGVLGPRTLAALNAPPSEHVRRIELALERLRWVPPLGARPFLVVNIPAYQLVGFDSATAPGPPAVSMRVVVGRAANMRTPLLYAWLRHVEFLPYWNVPRSILRNEILPMLEWNPGYLRSHDMELVGARGRLLGDSVTPAVLRGLRRGELRVRQRPGPHNALGLAKFIFPNQESVYLHDTPRKELFAESERDFSHGCISVEDPATLAAWVLRDRPEWTREAVAGAMAGTATTRIALEEPLPVLLFYTTAVARADGSVWFYPDVYGHDRELAEALKAGRDLATP